MKSNAELIIDQTVSESLPLIDLEIEMIEMDGLNIENKQHPPEAYASLEWIIPPLIYVFVFKSYFEGFLNKAGEDHYEVLKKWILKLNDKFRGFNTQILTARESENKINKNSGVPNNFFGLYFKTPKGNNLKVFMPVCLDEIEDIKALSELLDNLKKMYTKPESKFAKKIDTLSDKVYEELYAVYNNEKNKWEFFTSSMLIHQSIEKQHGNN